MGDGNSDACNQQQQKSGGNDGECNQQQQGRDDEGMLNAIEEQVMDMMDLDFKEEDTMRKSFNAVRGIKRRIIMMSTAIET